MKTCFLFGHSTAPHIVKEIEAAAQRHYLQYGVRTFIVGSRGDFDRMAATAIKSLKRRYDDAALLLLLAYHPAERDPGLTEGFDNSYYPPLESVPRKFCIIRANQYTADEVRLLMEKLPETKIGWSIRLLLFTGMRTQELLGLELRHIARDGSSITIEQAVVREKGTVAIGTPKSYDIYRTIPVPELVQYCARNLRDTDKKFIWEVGKPDIPCNPSHFRNEFKKAIGNIEGVRVLTPHCCRHTAVSQMQALGIDIETIQNIVGHAEIDMTRHYLHVQEPKRLEAMQRFSEAFSKKGRGTHGNILDYVKSS